MKKLPSSLTTLWTITGALTVLAVLLPQAANAQFHEKRDGQVVQRTQVPTNSTTASSRPQASYQNVTAAQAVALAAQQNGTASVVQPIASTRQHSMVATNGTNSASAITVARGTSGAAPPTTDLRALQFKTSKVIGLSDYAWKMKSIEQQGGEAEIAWGSAKHHPNGNYTIEKAIDGSLIQRTFTPPRTAEEHQKTDDERQPIERRVVQLDARGRPAEVLIYDIRNQLKFRGVLIYDNISGKFLEEQLLYPSNQIIRRRVQNYDSAGKPLPIKTYMDEDSIHADTSLVLNGQDSPTGFTDTGSAADTGSGAQASGQEQPKEEKTLLRRMMFWKK